MATPWYHKFRLALTVMATMACVVGTASDLGAQDWNRTGPPYPAYEPFTLNSYDVIQAVLMIRRSVALLHVDQDNNRTILPARNVRSVWVGFDPDAFETHQNRYDVLIDGTPLDWDHTYIEYSGELVNLRMLFSYNNQRPMPDTIYRTE